MQEMKTHPDLGGRNRGTIEGYFSKKNSNIRVSNHEQIWAFYGVFLRIKTAIGALIGLILLRGEGSRPRSGWVSICV
jgi:hypothetical protein